MSRHETSTISDKVEQKEEYLPSFEFVNLCPDISSTKQSTSRATTSDETTALQQTFSDTLETTNTETIDAKRPKSVMQPNDTQSFIIGGSVAAAIVFAIGFAVVFVMKR